LAAGQDAGLIQRFVAVPERVVHPDPDFAVLIARRVEQTYLARIILRRFGAEVLLVGELDEVDCVRLVAPFRPQFHSVLLVAVAEILRREAADWHPAERVLVEGQRQEVVAVAQTLLRPLFQETDADGGGVPPFGGAGLLVPLKELEACANGGRERRPLR